VANAPRKPVGPPFPLGANLIVGTDGDKKRLVNIIEQRLRTLEAWVAALAADLDISDIVEVAGGKKGKTFSGDDPAPVAAAPVVGTSAKINHSDHVHLGVTSIRKSSPASGPLTFSGTGVTQTGADFAFPGIGAAVFGTPVDIGTANAAGASSEFVRRDHVHRGALTVHADGSVSIYGEIIIQAGTGISVTQVGNTIIIGTAVGPTGGFDGLFGMLG
jgi:hypothetical protein